MIDSIEIAAGLTRGAVVEAVGFTFKLGVSRLAANIAKKESSDKPSSRPTLNIEEFTKKYVYGFWPLAVAILSLGFIVHDLVKKDHSNLVMWSTILASEAIQYFNYNKKS